MPTRISLLSALASALFLNAAQAEEYIFTLDAPLEEISDGLYQSLKISPLDAFEVGNVHYVVLDASNPVQVETLFSVYGEWPLSMSVVDAEWSVFSKMSPEKKLLNLTPVHCRFCVN